MPISFVKSRNKYTYLAFLIVTGVLISIVLARLKHGTPFWEKTVFDVGFGFGQVVENIVKHGEYFLKRGECNLVFEAARLPALPFLLYIFSLISPALWFAYLLKNLVFVAAFGIVLWPFVSDLKRFYTLYGLVFAVTFLSPLVAVHATAIEYEEGLIYFVVVSGVAGLLYRNSKGAWLATGAAVLLLLTKSSMFAAAGVLTVFAAYRLYQLRSWRSASIPVVLFAAVLLGWGVTFSGPIHGLALGSKMSSWNGVNLYKANNPVTDSLYPGTTLDKLTGSHVYWSRDLQEHCFESEWGANQYYLDQAWSYMAENPGTTARRWGVRLYLSLLEVRDWTEGDLPTWPSMIVLRLLFLPLLGLAATSLFTSAGLRRDTALLFLLLSGALIAPYVIGFVYQRHLIVLQGISIPVLLAYYQHFRSDE